nr:hypothetical protein [Rhodococcus sp. (in: high G+C Gram-positive bacteria)]
MWPNADQIGAIATVISALAVFLGAIRLGRSKVKIDDVAELQQELTDTKNEFKDKWEQRDSDDVARNDLLVVLKTEKNRLLSLDIDHRLYEHQLRTALAQNGIQPPPVPDSLQG